MKYLFLFLFVAPAWSDVLVLKNGKTIYAAKGWKVEGQFVLFHNKTGDLHKLPLKLVDLEKTEARNQPQEKTEAHNQPVDNAEVKKKSPETFQDWLAQQETHERGELSVGAGSLQKYAGRPVNESVESTRQASKTTTTQPAKSSKESNDLQKRYNELRLKLELLKGFSTGAKQLEKEANQSRESFEVEKGRRHIRERDLAKVYDDVGQNVDEEIAKVKRQISQVKQEAQRKGITLKE